jgi:pimeloyl-ACP methyl ester carboxylesterase
MELQELEAHRSRIETANGAISYIDIGKGPVALFIHGIFLNSYLWRNVIAELRSERRCIAMDLPAHGQSGSSPEQDLSLPAVADLLAAFCTELGIDDVDLVGNDTGGALCQVFAVRHRGRVRTLTLTNCDAHDNLPPEAFKQGKELAENGQMAPLIAQMANDPNLARSELGLAVGYEHAEALTDEIVRAYLGMFADPQRGRELERFMTCTRVEDLLAVEPGLRALTTPTLIVWGTGDRFFEADWAYWLRETIPGANEVIEIEGGKLFFPDERASELLPHLKRFLSQHSPVASAA